MGRKYPVNKPAKFFQGTCPDLFMTLEDGDVTINADRIKLRSGIKKDHMNRNC